MRIPDTGMIDPPVVYDALGRGIVVNLWLSEIDGKRVVQINTVDSDDIPDIRVFLNDGEIWGDGETRERVRT